MITLYDNAFSPFARKVRMVLERKGLAFDAFDALTPAGHARLAKVNPRIEVPVLVDGDLVVVNSSHIVAYLEHRYPELPVYPADPVARVAALRWERIADTLLDAITHDVSNGGFPAGTMPVGMLEAAREDLAPVYSEMESSLADRDFLCGELSIAELALFPHVTAVRLLEISFDGTKHPRLLAWYKRLRAVDVCRADLERTQAFLSAAQAQGTLQRPPRIVWRGDRIEWALARGFYEWFFQEIRRGRVAWPRR